MSVRYTCMLVLVALFVSLTVVSAGWGDKLENTKDQVSGFVDDVKGSVENRIHNVLTDDSNIDSDIWRDHWIAIVTVSPIVSLIVLALLIFCCYRCCCYVPRVTVYQQLPTPAVAMITTVGVQGPTIAHRY